MAVGDLGSLRRSITNSTTVAVRNTAANHAMTALVDDIAALIIGPIVASTSI